MFHRDMANQSLFWLGIYQDNAPSMIPWLFETDYSVYIWSLLSACSCPVPSYRTDERCTVLLIENPNPALTGYRLSLTVVAICFGLSKAVLSYCGYTTVPSTLDWVFGVLISISFFWLGLYETSSTQVLPAIFETDYTPTVILAFGSGLRGGFTVGNCFSMLSHSCLRRRELFR
ncbi:hypothetical protein JAAARDRAFT_581263 [Jaapia argillacea MUCL 33604]|uniref:Uncharacterized protein n=1 Tax=Jaapia argillacea MUCL 33604 TaxID=933084 RepID=A0A067P772_9AGAM|nr:hypothetical protein JAAARDRAFT_581263 [Jaapia argillacea MUCL 33604]